MSASGPSGPLAFAEWDHVYNLPRHRKNQTDINDIALLINLTHRIKTGSFRTNIG